VVSEIVQHVSMARVVVAAVLREGRSMSEVVRDYTVSRRWVQVRFPMSSGGPGSPTR
jgi:hypothetical protein